MTTMNSLEWKWGALVNALSQAYPRGDEDELVAILDQDLAGQIIRGVITLVSQIESALSELMRLGGVDASPAPQVQPMGSRGSIARGFGPAVPGV